MMHRINPDFNTMNMHEERLVLLPTHVEPHLLEYLRPGLRVVLYEPFDFEVEADVDYDADHDSWYGRPDWETKRDLESDELHRFRDLAYRLQEMRERSGTLAEQVALRQDAVRLWNTLTKEEREHLQQFPQYAEFAQSR